MMPCTKDPIYPMPPKTPIKSIGDYRAMILEVLMYRVDWELYHGNEIGAQALRTCITEIHKRNFEVEGALAD